MRHHAGLILLRKIQILQCVNVLTNAIVDVKHCSVDLRHLRGVVGGHFLGRTDSVASDVSHVICGGDACSVSGASYMSAVHAVDGDDLVAIWDTH